MMKAEIITIGTELLMGHTVNTNLASISKGLVDIGIGTYFHTVVGDNQQRIKEVLSLARERVDLIIVCGGLGPTEDDITKPILAEFLDEELIMDSIQKERIEEYFDKEGRQLTENNYRQAWTIQGALTLNNQVGLASGLIYQDTVNGKSQFYVALPGPPSELQPMLDKQLIPWLRERHLENQVIESEYINLVGIGEALVASRLESIIQNQSNPTIAIYAKPRRVTIRLTANGDSPEVARTLMQPTIEEIQSIFPQEFIGFGETYSIENRVIDLLEQQNQTLAVAESLTGGAVMSSLIDTAGAGKVICGGYVVYQTDMKERLLGIDSDLINKYGVVSSQIAQEMAERTLKLTGSNVALSLTGVAGPDSLEGHEPGVVFIGVARRNQESQILSLNIQYRSREMVRFVAKEEALNFVRKIIE